MRLITPHSSFCWCFCFTAENRRENAREPQSKIFVFLNSAALSVLPSGALEQEGSAVLCGKNGFQKIAFRLCIGLLFLILTNSLLAQEYNFRNFNTEDGLPQSYIYSVIQDDKGYLWVGTGNGLSRFNGFTFENFTIADSLADNFITCGISNGEALWFGHMNGRLSYFNGRNFQKTDLLQKFQSPVTHFSRSPDGSVWVSTYSGTLFKLENNNGIVKQNSFAEQVPIVTFTFIDSSELLVGTNAGLLYCRLNETGTIELIRSVSEIPESRISGIQKVKDKPVYIIATQDDGIFQLSGSGKLDEVSIIRVDTVAGSVLTGVQDIILDKQSNLWVATFGTGLLKIKYPYSGEPTERTVLNINSGFVADNVKSLFEDREGNIWSGNYGEGLTQINTRTFSIQTFNEQLFGNNIFSICFDQKHLWVGTENGLLKTDLINGKVLDFYSAGRELPKDTITSLYQSVNFDIWIGTGRNGLFRIAAGDSKIHKYGIDNSGALENSVTSITGKGEKIWVGTKKGLCSINSETGTITWYSIFKGGLPHNYINSLFYDSSGKLWVTTRSNSLTYIENDKVFKIPLNAGRGNLILSQVTEDMNSRIWVGSNGNGVFMIQPDSVINLTVKEGLLSDYCYSLICDTLNYIWVGHKGGLSKIRTADFMIKPVQHILNITDNYHFNPNAIKSDRNNRIMFGSDKGLVIYDPSLEPVEFLPPVLSITSLRINDEIVDFTENVVLPPGNYKIQIDFLGISTNEPSLVSYQYFLEGYDRWPEKSKNTSITYDNLTEGTYSFVLYCSSGDGAVTETPLKIDIVIKTPLWKKWWFYVVVVSLVVILVIIFIKRREQVFLAEKKILEEKVVERTLEIQIQKNEIEAQRDLIDQKNESITASIRYARHIQNAVLPPLEMINKLLSEIFILSKPKDIVSGDFYWMAEKDGRIVFSVADCTGHGVPGAFMGMLGIALLNEIVNINGETQSDNIVTKLRERVVESLQQGRKDIPTGDGMDIALCVVDSQHKKLQYSGGMSNLVYIRDGKLEVIKSDRFSVCFSSEDTGPFKLNELDINTGDIVYLFSDGYKDQFGGDFDKKFMVPHFYLTLLEIHKLPMNEQKQMLEAKLSDWMQETEQTDDVTIMGIRF